MIQIRFDIDQDGEIVGFIANNHGDKVICAAVSVLVINAINSIEWLAGSDFSCEHENEGYIEFRLIDEADMNARLLLESLRLGIRSIAEEHPNEVTVEEISVSVEWKEYLNDKNEFTVFRS